jgi:hypothetical protein
MRRTTWFLSASLAFPAFLTAQPTGSVARVFVTQVKGGQTAQYEAGRKRHMDWHRKQADTWAWFTWEVVTGERAGSFLAGTFGHQWKDFDDWEAKLGTSDAADGALNMAASTASQVNGFYLHMPEVSRGPGGEPPPMSELTFYRLNFGADQEFRSAIKKAHEAIGKSTWKVNYAWYEMVNGGDHPTYVLAFAMKGFADLAPQDPPFPAMLEKVMGAYDAQEVLKAIDRSVKSARSEIVRYRPDLSYVPAAK